MCASQAKIIAHFRSSGFARSEDDAHLIGGVCALPRAGSSAPKSALGVRTPRT